MTRTLLVSPPAALQARLRLFEALAAAFDVQFQPSEGEDRRSSDGIVVFSDDAANGAPVAGPPRFIAAMLASTRRRAAAPVGFTASPALDSRLHRRSMADDAAGAARPLTVGWRETVLAEGPAGALWTVEKGSGTVHRAAIGPDELAEGDRLKDGLRAGHFLGLLPLVHFLREVTGYAAVTRPQARATFVIDDPNLHWPSYGYVQFRRLARLTEDHRYHVAIAMPAIDGRFAHRECVTTIATSPFLSLIVHGNDHSKHELAQPLDGDQARAVVAQALRRTARFEERYGLAVDRVIVPPHSACSEVFMSAMRQLGCEAVLYRGPTGTSDPLVGWRPADIHLGGGLPGVHRMPLDVSDDEMVLRVFLDQPLVLYGHHADLRDPDVLTAAAGRVNRLTEVEWGSAAAIAATNLSTVRDGPTLRVIPFSRRFRVSPSRETTHLFVDARTVERAGGPVEIGAAGARTVGRVGEQIRLPVVQAGHPVEVRLTSPDAVDPSVVGPRAWSPWPVVRRCLTEARDRAQPLIRR